MNRHDVKGIVVIILLLSAIGGALAWSGQVSEKANVALDPETLCPIDGVDAHTALLLDRTDAFGEEYYAQLRLEIERAKNSLEIAELFSIFPIRDTTSFSHEPLFSICRPPRGVDTSWNGQNPPQVEARYAKLFADPLATHVQKLAEPSEAPYSPILEMMQGLSYLPNFDPRTMRLHLIIVSDFLQNVPEFSQYTDTPLSYEEFRKTPYAKTLNINLEGVEVTLVFVRNSKASRFQTSAQRAFWHDLIEDKGAIDTSTGGGHE